MKLAFQNCDRVAAFRRWATEGARTPLHVLRDLPLSDHFGGYLLGATRRTTVGTAVSVLSTQHPVALAEQAALLDQVSGGRFRIGRGGPWIDLEVFGTGMDRYQHGFTESVDLLPAALNRPRLAACGPNFRSRH